MFPPPALVPIGLCNFVAEHVKGQIRHFILVESCCIEGPWLPTVLNMWEDIPWQCPVIEDLIMDVSVGQVLKSLPCLNPLAAQ